MCLSIKTPEVVGLIFIIIKIMSMFFWAKNRELLENPSRNAKSWYGHVLCSLSMVAVNFWVNVIVLCGGILCYKIYIYINKCIAMWLSLVGWPQWWMK